ncbi:MAG TPA: LysM domain-containing protein [Bdellovibrionota bacterium]|nr:LysM domain-containing protein [Bdellovibrionota bacterium]
MILGLLLLLWSTPASAEGLPTALKPGTPGHISVQRRVKPLSTSTGLKGVVPNQGALDQMDEPQPQVQAEEAPEMVADPEEEAPARAPASRKARRAHRRPAAGDYSYYPEAPPGKTITISGVVIEPSVPDLPLDKRLTVEKEFITRPGDTLNGLAHLLYGHRTWWTRLKAENKQFLSYRPGDQLPPGKRISYRAANLGDSYVVRRNDWLVRIAQWKYGNTEFWKRLYERNRDRISDPDLIHPGDLLYFGKDGTIRMAKTGKVILQGVDTAPEPAPQPAPQKQVAQAPPPRKTAPAPEPFQATPEPDRVPTGEATDTGWPMAVWVAVLLVLLAMALVAAGIWRTKNHGPSAAPAPERPRGPYDTMNLDEPFLDNRNLEYIEVPTRPSYHTVTAGWFRKQMNKLRKLGRD